MLVRSAGRRNQRHSSRLIAASFSQLQLPWLAPAQLRWQTSHSSPPSLVARRDSTSQSRHSAKEQVRKVATATHDAYGSVLGQDSTPWNLYRFEQGMSNTRPGEPYSQLRQDVDPIMRDVGTATPDPVIKVVSGVTGSVMDLLQHLHSSLRVGKVERALAIVQRLAEATQPNSPELLYAYTAIMEEWLKSLATRVKGSAEARNQYREMQRWLEQEVQAAGNKPSSAMVVIMIKASIAAFDGAKRTRAIRRYVELSKELGEEEHEEALYSEEYSDDEFAVIGQTSADFYDAVESGDRIIETVSQQVERAIAMENATAVDSPEKTVYVGTRPDPIDLDELPAVTSAAMKGSGLYNIKRTLMAFADLPALPPDAPSEAQLQRQFERQMLLEETSVKVAMESWREADEERQKMGIHSNMSTKSVSSLMWSWHEALMPTLREEVEASKSLEMERLHDNEGVAPMNNDSRFSLAPYLELLPLEQISAVAVLVTAGMFSAPAKVKKSKQAERDMDNPVRMNNFCYSLGCAVEAECSLLASKERMKRDKTYKRYAASLAVSRLRRLALKQFRDKDAMRAAIASRAAEKRSVSKLDRVASMEWPMDVKVRLGAMIAEKILATAKVPVTKTHPRNHQPISTMQPAFSHRNGFLKGKKFGILEANPELLKALRNDPSPTIWAKRMPMIVEPRPWSDHQDGAYLQYKNNLLRLHSDKTQLDYFRAAHARGDSKQLMAGLNVLGKTPWLINLDVFKVQLDAWNTGEEIANFAPVEPSFDMPPSPEKDENGEFTGGPDQRRKYIAELKAIANIKAGLHSKRCFQNFQMEVAKAVANDTIYFPHNIDFRGRAYPIPPYLNHMGADNVRGLMIFAKGKELGALGLRWLKIHLANVAGHDKASLKEREEFTNTHVDDIRDSVANPLGGRRWWLKSEDAWQTLAACFELVHALDHSEGPEKYISHLPIHQDGTCNGLQHYAALGGDQAGAAQVNLQPGDRPSDIYTAVAEAVKEEVARDVENGNPIAQKLHGHITRKVVKQPVMTNVYGVTFFGAQAQVKRQLVEIFPQVRRYDDVSHGKMAHYITTKIFNSLGSMFEGAQRIQRWLGQCADRITMNVTLPQIKQLVEAEAQPSRPSRRGLGSRPVTSDMEYGELEPELDVIDLEHSTLATKETKTRAKKPKEPQPKKKMGRPRKVPPPVEESASGAAEEESSKSELEATKPIQAEALNPEATKMALNQIAKLKGQSPAAVAESMKQLFRSTVTWTTPLRMPVVQPYRTHTGKTVATNLQAFTIQQPQLWDPTQRRKQLQAFPPNFIHSLDATHMLLSALKCDEEGLTFASVHDSFWTHACDITQLSTILRDQFIAMHGDDIMQRLKEEFDTRYKDGIYVATLKRSSAIEKIYEWRRAKFGKINNVQYEEMKIEYERQMLLKSEDPEERAKGEEMVTPATIFREAEGEKWDQALHMPGEIKMHRLGLTPEQLMEDDQRNADSSAIEGDDFEEVDEGKDEDDLRDPMRSQEDDEDADSAAAAITDGATSAEHRMATSLRAGRAKYEKNVYIWLPMEFPDVPKRGEFDVRNVSSSNYFFH